MEDQETITIQEARKLLLKDITTNLVIGAVSQSGCVAGLGMMANKSEGSGWVLGGIAAVAVGSATTLLSMKFAYDKIKLYVNSPDFYLSEYHNKRLEY